VSGADNRTVGERIAEAATRALIVEGLDPTLARERMSQIGTGFDVFGREILAENGVPSVFALVRPTLEAMRLPHVSGIDIDDATLDLLAGAASDAILEIVAVECGHCRGFGRFEIGGDCNACGGSGLVGSGPILEAP